MIKVLTTAIIVAMSMLFVQVYFSSSWEKQAKSYKIQYDNLQTKYDSVKKVSDSLYWELFPTQIELGRYQVALDIFLDRNPKAAKEYSDIISNETE